MKKIIGLLLVVVSFMVGSSFVNAETFTAEQIKDKFFTTRFKDILSSESGEIVIDGNKLVVRYPGENNTLQDITYFTVENNAISWVNPLGENFSSGDPVGETISDMFFYFLAANAIESVKLLANVDEKIVLDADKTYSYATDGYEMSFKHLEENVENGKVSTDRLLTFKLSLDKDTVVALFAANGVEGETIDDYAKSILPVVSYGDVTDSKVSLYAKANANDFFNTQLYCVLYRSDAVDGEFKALNEDNPIPCDGETAYVDKDLNANTTYYYKAFTIGGSNFGDVISVKTEVAKGARNPKTGWSSIYVAIGIVVIMMGVCIITILNKKDVFKKSI